MTHQQLTALAKSYLYAFPKFASNLQCPIHLKFIADKIQDKLNKKSDKYKLLLISVPPRHGKPVDEESLVLMGDGSLKKLKYIEVGDWVITHEGRPRKVDNVYVQGELDCVNIETKSGRIASAALDHPYLTPEGWVNAGDIEDGMCLTSLAEYSERDFIESVEQICESRLIGYFIGDGCCVANGTTCFSSIIRNDEIEAEDIKYCINKLNFKEGNPSGMEIRIKCGVRKWLKAVDLYGKSSHTKRVPKIIFTGSNDLICNFLGAYFACDGSINKRELKRKDACAEFYSVSKLLLKDVQHLLLRIGVQSTLRLKNGRHKGKRHISWRLSITSQDDIRKFAQRVPIFNDKREILDKWSYYRQTFNQNFITDRVIEVTKNIKKKCRCLDVADDHTFIADDFIVHNTLLISKHTVPWYLGNNPKNRVILTSYSSDLSDENSDFAKDIFAKWGPILWNAHPSKSLYNRNKWNTTEGGGCVSAGIGGGIIGFGADLFIIDDYFKGPEEAESQGAREKLWSKWQAIVGTRLHPGCLVIILACMTGDTKISMSNGSWKYLKDIKINDEILTYKSNKIVKRKILDFVKHKKDEIYEIKTGNNTVKANTKHPFLVELENGKREWKKVKELMAGDRLISISKNNNFNNKKINYLEAWLLGFMFRDGWITVRNNINYNKKTGKKVYRKSNVTCVAIKKNKYKDVVTRQLFKKLFNTNLKDTGYGYYRTEIQKTGRWFLEHGLIGNSHTKRLPYFIFEECLENRLSFIEGFCNADGWNIKKGKFEGYGIKLCNELLLEDIRHLARSCGYKPTNIYKQNQRNKPPHSKTIIESTSYTFHFSKKRSDSEFIISRIRKINKLEKDYVYDITVDDTECFIADGLVSHNTRWNTDDLMGRLINQAELEGKEFPFDWEYINLPAIAIDDPKKPDPLRRKPGEALWPKRYNKILLNSAKKIVGPYWWGAEFQGEPSKLGGNLFKSQNFRYYTIEALTSEYLCWRVNEEEPIRVKKSDLKIAVIVDPALEIKKKNDPCGMLAWGYSRKHKIWLLIDRFNDKIEHQKVSVIGKNFAFKNNAHYILVENEKLGKIIVKSSAGKDKIGNKKIPFKEVPTKGLDKYTRAVPMATYCENERVFFPKDVPWLMEYEQNIKDFPTGGHDEDADLTAYASIMEDKISIAEVLAGR